MHLPCISQELARATGCPECSTLECQQARCQETPDWHLDGDGHRQSRLHKFWLMLERDGDH